MIHQGPGAVLILIPIVDAKSGKRRKPGQDAARFKTDDETGKMVIDNEDDDEGDGGAPDDAYKESLTSADGFTRGPNGRVKFNKDTKKRRRENADNDEDVEMGDADAASGKKSKRRSDVKLGHEFRSKVRSCELFLSPLHYTDVWCRKQEATSRKVVWNHMPTCRCHKQPKSRDARASQGNDEPSSLYVSISIFRASCLVAVVSHLIATRWAKFRQAMARERLLGIHGFNTKHLCRKSSGFPCIASLHGSRLIIQEQLSTKGEEASETKTR